MRVVFDCGHTFSDWKIVSLEELENVTRMRAICICGERYEINARRELVEPVRNYKPRKRVEKLSRTASRYTPISDEVETEEDCSLLDRKEMNQF